MMLQRKRKETVAKIFELLDGLSYYEANCVLESAKKSLENVSFMSLQTYWDRQKSVAPTEFEVVYDFTTVNQ